MPTLRRRAARSGFLILASVTWLLLATQSWAEGWRLASPTFGPGLQLRGLEAAPSNPQILYVPATGLGVWKTVDAGKHWFPAGQNLPSLTSGSDVAIDPADPDRVFLASQRGLYRSDDGGASWSAVDVGLPGFGFQQIEMLVDDAGRRILYLGDSDAGFLRSVDGGTTWEHRGPTVFDGDLRSLFDFDVDPRDPDHVTACWWSHGLLESFDGGRTWSDTDTEHVFVVTRAPSAPNVLYGISPYHVYRSTDGGATWSERHDWLAAPWDLSVDPRDADVVYAATLDGLRRSTDGGATWTFLTSGEASGIHLAPRGAALDVLTNTDGVVRRSANEGATFVDIDVSAPTSITLLALEPGRRGRLLTTTSTGQHRKIFRSHDRGHTWSATAEHPPFPGLTALLADPDIEDRLYGGFLANDLDDRPNLYWSADGGATWREPDQPPGDGWVSDLTTSGSTLWAAASFGVWRSTDRGLTWRQTGDAAVASEAWSRVLLSADGTTVWAAGPEGLARGAIQGASVSWTRLEDGLPARRVQTLALAADGTLYVAVGLRQQMLRSDDGGVTWTHLAEAPGSIYAMQADPRDADRLFVSSIEEGIFESRDRGATWTDIGTDLPTFGAYDIALDPAAPATLYVGTTGAGVWAKSIDGPESVVTNLCDDDPSNLCLDGGRFEIRVDWRTPDGQTGRGRAVPLEGGGDSGLVWFFGVDNWEILIKVLDGCPINDRYWVIAGSATDIEYTLYVTDRFADVTKSYFHPFGREMSTILDVDALATCDASPPQDPVGGGNGALSLTPDELASLQAGFSSALGKAAETPAAGTCTPFGDRLCFHDRRFEARISWRTGDASAGMGRAVESKSSDSGMFWFFGDENWETLLKVLNGCAINDHYWVFAASATDVPFDLVLRDTASGREVVYAQDGGELGQAITDVAAFPCPESP